MPHVRTETLYYFDELSDKAKQVALDEHRYYNTRDARWWDGAYEDIHQVAPLLGIELDIRNTDEPTIYFSGFASQGDGACFEGTYRHDPESPKKIREFAPKDEVLHRIADDLARLGTGIPFLYARVKHSGRYYHKYCTEIDVTVDGVEAGEELAKAVKEALRDFMEWIYRQLETEHTYQTSDEAVAEGLRANSVEFYENGRGA